MKLFQFLLILMHVPVFSNYNVSFYYGGMLEIFLEKYLHVHRFRTQNKSCSTFRSLKGRRNRTRK